MKPMEAPSSWRCALVSLLAALGGILPGHRDWLFLSGTPSDSLLSTPWCKHFQGEEKFIH